MNVTCAHTDRGDNGKPFPGETRTRRADDPARRCVRAGTLSGVTTETSNLSELFEIRFENDEKLIIRPLKCITFYFFTHISTLPRELLYEKNFKKNRDFSNRF